MAAAREDIHGETPSLVQVADYIVGSFSILEKSERRESDGMSLLLASEVALP